MNKYILIGFVSLFFLLFGCTQETLPYIEKSVPDQNVIKSEESFNLRFFVYNPSINTFIGTLNYTYNTDCLVAVDGDVEEISISPSESQGIVKEFKYSENRKTNYGGYVKNEPIDCFQKALPISVSLYDKSGLIRDKKEVFLTISG